MKRVFIIYIFILAAMFLLWVFFVGPYHKKRFEREYYKGFYDGACWSIAIDRGQEIEKAYKEYDEYQVYYRLWVEAGEKTKGAK